MPLLGVHPHRAVNEAAHVEVSAQALVEMQERVAVELRCHAGGVVVGVLQHGRFLGKIDTDEERPLIV